MSEVETCIVTQYADYVFDKENIWNPECYLPGRTLSGKAFGKEANLRFQYCLGNSYAEGYIEDYNLRIFGHGLQGYQVYLWPSSQTFEEYSSHPFFKPVTFHPDRKEDLINHLRDFTAR